MKKATLSLFAAIAMGVSTTVLAAPFTAGDIVVSRIGDGSGSLSSGATAVYLDEYTTTGTFVQTLALPTADNGTQHAFTNSGSATSEGALILSGDGQYLTLAGYDAAPGISKVASTTSAANPRVIARVDFDGNIDTSTALTDAASGNNARSAVTSDGNTFWFAGAAGGVRSTILGATTSTQVSTTLSNVRVVNIFNGQLSVSSNSGTHTNVSTVGTGISADAGQTITSLTGMPTSSASPYDFYFSNPSTLYVADDGSTSNPGGIEKWTFDGSTWSLVSNVNTSSTGGMTGLTGEVSNGVTTLFAITTDNKLVTVTDNGSFSAFTTLETGATNTVLRGVALAPVAATSSVPEPTALGMLALVVPAIARRRRRA